MTGRVLQFPLGGGVTDEALRLIPKAASAAALGCSERTLDRFVKAGAPSHRVGGRVMFRRAELLAWYAARRT